MLNWDELISPNKDCNCELTLLLEFVIWLRLKYSVGLVWVLSNSISKLAPRKDG